MPNSKFAIIMPIMRPAIKWYQEGLDHYKSQIKEEIKKECLGNVSLIDSIPVKSQIFAKDGVHLTAEAGKVFVQLILDSAEDFFDAENVDIADIEEEENIDLDDVEEEEDQNETLAPEVDDRKLAEIEKRLDDLEKAFALRVSADDLVFARIREEIDSAANKQKEDRIVINGITSKTPIPSDRRLAIERYKTIATEIFRAIKPDFEFKIVFVSPGRNNGSLIPMIEIKMDTFEQAIALRRAFAEKRKAGTLTGDMGKLFVSNCVNLATRVRIDILKAIAAKITTPTEIAYTFGFTSKPMLHIKPKGTDQRPARSFSFIDAIKNFGKSLNKKDLEKAYARAGMAFDGQLQQNFVVLKDSEVDRLSHSGPMRGSYKGKGFQRGRGNGRGKGSKSARGYSASTSQWSKDYAAAAASTTPGTSSTSGANSQPIGDTQRGTKRKGEDKAQDTPSKKPN
jgi:hypothetical protein